MDQVKVFLKVLKKHHFWVLVSLAALFGLVCWWMGANSLAKETETNKGTVTKSFKDLQDVQGKSNPPNSKFTAGVNEKHEGLKAKVLEEWAEQFKQQQALFQWPECVAADMAKLKPGDPITDDNVRQRYKNLAYPGTLEKVFLAADYRRPVNAAAAPAATPAEEGAPADKPAEVDPATVGELAGLVVWRKSHQDELRQRYNLEKELGIPSSQNIIFVQEDMWMLENLARVVQKTNEGAADIIAAPIKRIDSLDVAQWAVNDAIKESPKIMPVDKSEGGGRNLGGNAAAANAPADAETAEDRAKRLDDALRDGRYVNDQGQPLLAADPPPYAEFNLMFVRLRVVIDQRKIPDLLVNCANAPIPIEVLRIAMFDPLISPTGGGAATSSAPAAGGGGFAGRSGSAGGGAVAAPTAKDEAADKIEPTPADVTVEVCGLVQIFNPPDPEKLGTGGAADPGKRPFSLPATLVTAPRSGSGGRLSGGLR